MLSPSWMFLSCFQIQGNTWLNFKKFFMAQLHWLFSSKDTFVKFWDLETQHCFKTIVEHRSEVYDFVLIKEDTRLVTGSGDSELRVWNVDYDTQVHVCTIEHGCDFTTLSYQNIPDNQSSEWNTDFVLRT